MLLPKQSRNYVTGLAAACSLLLIACSPEEVRQVNLIPKPEQMTMTGGTFTVDSLALFGGQSSRNIKTVIDEAWSGNPEGYQLDVTPGGIDLRAGSPDGSMGCRRYANSMPEERSHVFRSGIILVLGIGDCIWMYPVISSPKRK